ncbi:MAG: glutamate--tRNA ligase [Gemmatimonadetes bacterium]|nr:glutamate--tRNA ligase [Gemmatimonadota bacterium]
MRTRFAPSPTGTLHVGNVRIAIFNWLFTRRHGGRVILRIEDTDPQRNVPGAEVKLREDLRWLGLDWDEGPDSGGPCGPYRQSERTHLYRLHAEQLVQSGKAYRCYCAPHEIGDDGAETGEPTRYSGRCRDLTGAERARFESQGRVPSIRFRVPRDVDGVAPDRKSEAKTSEAQPCVEIADEIKGEVSFPLDEFDDFVLLRSDGRPVYNFAVVVDDVLMRITHVIRGVGHLSNTPKQALLFDALGVPRPRFAHLPMVLGADRAKLSKRAGAWGVAELRAAGYHPDAVVNYLSLLGWSSASGDEFLTRERLIAEAGFARVGTSDTVFDLDKLRWLSSRHIDAMPLEDLVHALDPWIDAKRFPLRNEARPTAVAAVRSRLHTFAEIHDALKLFFPDPSERIQGVRAGLTGNVAALRVLEGVARRLDKLPSWLEPELAQAIREAGRELDAKGAQLYHPIRQALTGSESGPELVKMLVAVGREETLRRIRDAIAVATQQG